MKLSRFSRLLIVTFTWYATAPAIAQSSSPDNSTALTQSTAANPQSNAKATATQTPSDRELAKRVRKALSRSGMVMVDLTVRAKNGAITLIGSVPTDALVAQAKAVSLSVDGVTSVDNRLVTRIDPRLLSGQSAGTGIPGRPLASPHKAD